MPAPWIVPALWSGARAVLIAGGPSLTAEHVELCRGRAKVLAINDAYRLAPWADMLYFCDSRWWEWHRDRAPYRDFAGERVTLSEDVAAREPGVRWLRNGGVSGYDERPDCLRNGANSGYQALHLAVHLGARHIVLLGYDLRLGEGGKQHWFGAHPGHALRQAHLDIFKRNFESIVAPLAARGVTVVNATPGSALDCFPTASLSAALAGSAT